jgi:glycosyltransferase involved in cell wall biosynthesis
MRILFLARSLEVGGAERQLGTLAAGLQGRGHSVEIAVFYGGGALEALPRAAGVPVVALGKTSRWDLFAFSRRAFAEVKRFDPDTIYGFLVAANLFSVVARRAAPRARIAWGLRAGAMDWSQYDRFQGMTFAVSRFAARFADVLIVNSEAGVAYHAGAGFPLSKLRAVPNGIDLDAFRPDRALGARQRAEWGLCAGDRLYGIVARLDPMKDHATFLAAATRVASADPRARFVAIGGGPAGAQTRLQGLPDAVRLGGRLIWAGESGDMLAAYNALDVLVQSSIGEGFPNAVAEAMACGVTCAVTDVGDAARIVGTTGLVVPPGDVTALAEAMLRLGSSPENQPPAAMARERIAREYSVEAMCEATERVLSGTAEPAWFAASSERS